MPQQLSTNTFTTAKWIVSSTISNGTHTTIAGALASASSGDTIFIRPGTYTENLTLVGGVDLVSYPGQGRTPNVTITGKCTGSYTGSVTISGIRLQTNSDYVVEMTGATAPALYLIDCDLSLTNGSGIHISNTGGAIVWAYQCRGDLASTFKYFVVDTGTTSQIKLFKCDFYNSGGSTTASTVAGASGIVLEYCDFFNPITSSGTSSVEVTYTSFAVNNTTCLTLGGSGSNTVIGCNFDSGTASAISIGATATVTLCDVFSSNTNAITGAGTINYSSIVFSGSSSLMNVTTQNALYANLGKYKASGQPAFLAYVNTTIADVTGDGTVYTIIPDTESYDIGGNFTLASGTFTAPVADIYSFGMSLLLGGGTLISAASLRITTTSGGTFQRSIGNSSGGVTTSSGGEISVSAQMAAGDTCTFQVQATDTGGKVDDVSGVTGGIIRSWIWGHQGL